MHSPGRPLTPPLASPLQPQRPAPPPPAGLQHASDELGFMVAGPEHAIAAGSEEQLLAALAAADLGWRDRRVVQLTADIELRSTLVITSPVRLQGNCPNAPGGRCTLRGSAAATDAAPQPLPLVHISGPAAVVELANMELTGGRGSGSLAGGLTASNHSLVDLVAVRLAGNVGTSGGAVRIDSHARLTLTGCEVAGNTAQVGCFWPMPWLGPGRVFLAHAMAGAWQDVSGSCHDCCFWGDACGWAWRIFVGVHVHALSTA